MMRTKRFLLLLVALLALTTQAWAQSTPTEVSTFDALQTALSAGNDVKLTANIQFTTSITISDSKKITIDGNGKTMSTTSEIRAFQVGSSATVAFKNLTLTGFVSGGGPAINNSGTIVLDGCTISNCHVNNSNGGGAIENKSNGKLYAINTTFSGNYSGEIGGAINNYNGNLYLSGCTFTNNYTTATNANYGGAIGNNSNKTLVLVNCTFSGNKYGGSNGTAGDLGIFNTPGTYTIAGCTGIAIDGATLNTYQYGTATLDYSDLSAISFTYDKSDTPIYTLSMQQGVKDADKWTVKVGEGEAQALPIGGLKGDGTETVTLKYNGRLKVKSVTATTDAAPAEDPLATPLTIEAITDGTIKVNISGALSTDMKGMKYSVNGGTPTLITTTTSIEGLKAGDKVQFYGNGTSTQAYGDSPEVQIQGSGDGFQTKVYGNIMSLLDEEGFATKTDLPNRRYVFYGLFADNTTLTDASELLLPAATLVGYACYQRMFLGCTSLTTAPKLPATTLAEYCYFNMFKGCTSLTNAYVKAAYTIANEECSDMFTDSTATGAVLHTTPDNKASWEDMMGTGMDWENWTVADDWQE